MQITTRLEFDAGHRIPSHKSQCRNLHGHRYAIEITLSGDVIHSEGVSDDGMVMDFSDVKAIARSVGFSGPAALSRAFSRRYGVSPRQAQATRVRDV